MNADAPEKDRLPIEQNIGPIGADGAKANLINQTLLLCFDEHLVQLRRLGRPVIDFSNFEFKCCIAPFCDNSVDKAKFRDFDGHRFAVDSPVELHMSRHRLRLIFFQLNQIVSNETCGLFNQNHFSRHAPVIPPVGVHSGHRLLKPLVVHLDNQKIVFGLEQGGDFKIKRREATLMRAQFFAVQIDLCLVIYSAEINKQPVSCLFFGVVKRALEPDRAFIVEKVFFLRIPVARHSQGR